MVKAVEVRPVQPGDIEELVAKMRQADRDEVEACGLTPKRALQMSVRLSTECWTALGDGEMGCMFGVGPINMVCGIGGPWLLGTEAISRNPGTFMKHAAKYIPRMLEAYPHLFNFVDVRNTKAIGWLKRVGFTLHEPVPHGPFGMMFYPFEMKV